jgi:hypothetical protein
VSLTPPARSTDSAIFTIGQPEYLFGFMPSVGSGNIVLNDRGELIGFASTNNQLIPGWLLQGALSSLLSSGKVNYSGLALDGVMVGGYNVGGKRKVYVFTNGEVKEEERDPEVTEFTEAHLSDLDKIFPPKQTSLALVSKQTSTTTTSATSDTEDQDTEGKFCCPDCKANDTSFRCEVCFSCSICCQTTDMSMMMHEHCPLEDEVTKDEDGEEEEDGRVSRYLCESCYASTNMFCAACRDCPDCCTCVDPKVVINE